LGYSGFYKGSDGMGNNNQQGFTLIELIVVITLMSLVVGIVGVNLGMRLPKERLKAAVRDVVSTLRYAKNRSQTKTEEVIVKINLNERYIEAFKKRKSIPENIEIYALDPEQGQIRDGVYKIIFFPGYGCSGGEIILKTEALAYSIKIDPLTGGISVERLE
jgi:prepilin-type N-terminal cleavage/methylation domain-containing protein